MNILSVLSQKHLRRQPGRSGFTLVELLLVVAIIAILSTLAVGMLRTAQLEARTSATEGRIALIQTILSTYIEDMEFRKLPFRDSDIRNWAGAGATYGEAQALREKILVDYLNAEMPSRNSELGKFPTLNYPQGNVAANLALPRYQTALIRQWYALKNASIGEDSANDPLSGELLYKLLEMIKFEGESALEVLGNSAQGNVDDDNFPEIVDSWGEPLQFEISWRDATQKNLENLRIEVWSNNVDRRVEFQ
ncbi:MAG: type II secretion system protein [Planctomycetota bacterium]|nr:type II secretion system protein [Planctomycetota bacterium]